MKSDKKEKIISMRDYPKAEREFFEDDKGEIKYVDFCMNCSNPCKQSHKVTIFQCKKKDLVHTPKEYIKEILKQDKDISTIGRDIGINSRTVKSMLYENQDMSFVVYDKLDRLLYLEIKRNKNVKK